jgi:hypothetical protein
MGRKYGPDELAPGTILEIFELKNQQLTYDQIAAKLNISKNKVISDLNRNPTRWQRRTKEQVSQIHSLYTEEQKAQCLALRAQGVSLNKIQEQTGVNPGSIRAWCGKQGVLLNREQHNNNLRHEDVSEKRSEIIDFKKSGVANDDIVLKTGINLGTVKRIVRENGIKATSETISKNLSIARQPYVDQAKVKFFQKIFDKKGQVLGSYVDSSTFIHLKCEKSHVWNMRPGDILNSDQWCPECFNEARRGPDSFVAQNKLKELGFSNHLEWYTKIALEHGGRCLATENVTSHSKVRWECGKLHIWEAKPNTILNGHWCPSCSNVGPSEPQLEIADYIRSIIGPDEEIILSTRKILTPQAIADTKYTHPLELDIFVPTRKFALEFNGLIWHCSALDNFKSGKEMTKAVTCHKLGLKYLMIYEDEWKDKKELIKAMIASRLGVAQTKKLRASKLQLKLLENKEDWEDFFEKNHLDGSVGVNFGYGLFLEDKLISCATVRRKEISGDWELARFATDYNYHVHGNATRLIKAIKKHLEGAPLVTFSNNRLSSGNVYSKIGGKDITKTFTPGYFYTDGMVRINRRKCRRINTPEILAEFPTELDQAEGGVFSRKIFGDERPLYRIEDAGNKLWLL